MRLESGGEAERSPGFLHLISARRISYGQLVESSQKGIKYQQEGDLLGRVVQPLDLHLVNVVSIPFDPTHG